MEHPFLLLALALILGGYMAWSIGANDVANAMGTSVGSGALTLKRALIVAAVLEFCGAYFVGGHVSETIESGIVNTSLYADQPMVLICGMLSALIASGLWLQTASYFGWPVSTTHSIIGAVVGFGIVSKGLSAIYWGEFTTILSSWIISPMVGGIVSYFLFNFVRRQIFYHEDALLRTRKLFPWITFCVFFLLGMIVFYKGISGINVTFTFLQALFICIGVGLISAAIAFFLAKDKDGTPKGQHEQFIAVEKMFISLQIITACCMAFAHGANDVANAIGPVSAVVSLIQHGIVLPNTPVPGWILALGGLGIVIGLATWGWRVIETIGKKITELTPSRGFCAEFGAAMTILFASKLGMPISTTHTLVGSVLGVGLAGGIGALNLHMMRDIVLSWVVTVPAGALFAIIFYWILSFILI